MESQLIYISVSCSIAALIFLAALILAKRKIKKNDKQKHQIKAVA